MSSASASVSFHVTEIVSPAMLGKWGGGRGKQGLRRDWKVTLIVRMLFLSWRLNFLLFEEGSHMFTRDSFNFSPSTTHQYPLLTYL